MTEKKSSALRANKKCFGVFERKLWRALRPYPPEARYLVGVSGGRDSVALLHGLVGAGYRRLVVCHLDHGLRGRASRADARFVGRFAETLGLPVESSRVEVRALAEAEKLSVETAAREARYRFFAEVARRKRCRIIFLAHQADDQAETFLFNLLRGAGPAGLAAMAVESDRVVGRCPLKILRPLLGVWRTEIDEYLAAAGLKWREDQTNADPAVATRNRLRVEVLPALERALGREVKGALWRAADLLGAEEIWIRGLMARAGPMPEMLPVKTLRAQPLAEQRRTVRAWLTARGVAGVGYVEVERVLMLVEAESALAKVNLPGNRHARRRRGTIFVE